MLGCLYSSTEARIPKQNRGTLGGQGDVVAEIMDIAQTLNCTGHRDSAAARIARSRRASRVDRTRSRADSTQQTRYYMSAHDCDQQGIGKVNYD